MQLVWFKRDLRTHDHAPLWEASQRGPVLPLYIIEPSLLNTPDFSAAHYTFILASLHDLREALAALGQPLIVRIGEAVPTLRALTRQLTITHIWAHEETGNALTRQRNKAVRAWATSAEIPLTELPTNGVIRNLPSRDQRNDIWQTRMKAPQIPTPTALQPVTLNPGRLPDHKQLKLPRDRQTNKFTGGQTAAQTLLDNFLQTRGNRYFDGDNSLINSAETSSRLSAHLTLGTLSQRQTIQATRRRIWQIQRIKDSDFDRPTWLRALKTFESRLHLRDNFIQKLEDEPAIEQHNFIHALDGLREPQFNADYFDRWCKSQTGYPLVDAAMRALTATGWLPNQLRALLISFASYDLWLHWQQPAHHLARATIDYNPGIHYPQIQRHSGTTGINTIRLIDPTQHAIQHDPNGTFIRHWLPELNAFPDQYIHQPWKAPAPLQSNTTYPRPIVQHHIAGPAAVARLQTARNRPTALAQSQAVLQKHGPRHHKTNRTLDAAYQLEFTLGL